MNVNLYIEYEKLIAILKKSPSFIYSMNINEEVIFNFSVASAVHERPLDAVNIFITDKLPEKIYHNVKYILCSNSPDELDAKTLEIIYDIWPESLSPDFVKFLFQKLQERIKSELENNSEALEYKKRLIEMAHQDHLTGLATRWYLQEYVQNNQHEENITCIYFDLDNFKSVNDSFGHMAGDRALAATGEMLQREFAEGLAARMGGDEFMVVLPGLRKIEEVKDKVNTFMKNLAEYYETTRTMKALSVSAGISQRFTGVKKSMNRLIHESDMALYAAKKSGKNCCKIYDESMEI